MIILPSYDGGRRSESVAVEFETGEPGGKGECVTTTTARFPLRWLRQVAPYLSVRRVGDILSAGAYQARPIVQMAKEVVR